MKLNFVISHCGLFQDAGVHVSLTQQVNRFIFAQ